jgi:hypothetical protein
MKKLFIFSFLLLLSFSGYSQLEPTKEVILSDTFCFSNKKPLPFVAGSRIKTECDTVYIINKHRYNLYEESVTMIKTGKYVNACNATVKSLEDRIESQNKAFYQLYNTYMALDSVSQKSINDTRTSLIQVNNTLVNTQNNIVEVDKKMGEIKKTINQQRRQSFMDKILYGTGGVAVGILVGLIIAR